MKKITYLINAKLMEIYLSLIVLVVIVALSYYFPASIGPNYLFLSNFFVFDLPFFYLNTSKIYALSVIIILVIHAIKNKKLEWRKDYYFLISFFIFIPFIIGFYHLYFFKYWPKVYFLGQIKALWALGLLFLPRDKLSLKHLTYFSLIYLLISVAMVFPLSISYYLKTGMGPGRALSMYWGNKKLMGPGGIYWPVIDDNVYENLSVFSAVLCCSLVYYLVKKNYKIFFSLLLCFLFVAYVFYINQFLITLLMLGLNTFLATVFFWVRYRHWKNLRKRVIIFLLLFFTCGAMLISRQGFTKKFKGRFDSSELTLDKNSNVRNGEIQGLSRIAVFEKTLLNFVNKDPLIGLGDFHQYEEVYYPELPLTHSGHSTIFDNIISFGIIFGLLANLYYLVPFFIILYYGRELFYKDPLVFVGLFLLMTGLFMMSLETIYGRESLQVSFIVSLSTILLAKLRKGNKQEPRLIHD